MKKMFCVTIALLILCGCNTVITDNVNKEDEATDAYNLSFSESDLKGAYELNGSTYISLGDEDVKISKAGTYILDGNLNGSIIVEAADDEDVQLVLNNVTISSGDFAGIYIIEADEVTITLPEGTVSTISDSGAYTQIDSNDVDALIYSKADLIINGTGTLNLKSSSHHGIVSKDDLVIGNGTFNIDVAGQGLSGKDCLMISDGTFTVSSGKDALKSDNEEDEYRGYVSIAGGNFVITSGGDAIYGYSLVNIEGGTFDITTAKSSDADSYKGIKSGNLIIISGGGLEIDAADDGIHSDADIMISGGNLVIESDDDGIHADAKLTVDDGDITISAHEGIEATYVLINGGEISISASDDGINAAQKVNAYTATVEINGGHIMIDMGQGDTDAVDSNGSIYINGGTLEINAQFAFDYDREAQHNGGTIIVNGSETEEITNQFEGGFQGFGGQRPDNNSSNGNIPGGFEQSPDSGFPGFPPGGENDFFSGEKPERPEDYQRPEHRH